MASKIKGKEWYTLVAPLMFKNKILGETLVTDPKDVVGRTVIKSFPELGGHPSKYYVRIKFKAVDVKGKIITTKFVGQECLRDFILQMVRKGSSRIDNVVKVTTKDKKNLIIKSIAITLRRTNTSIKSKVRKEIESMIKEKAEKMKVADLVNSVLRDSFQIQIRKNLNKIYPIKKFEIRKIEVV
ncbi:MAG: hypothetical protein J7L45_01875 [Candidatus Aenigmarchaeota archaeon]|nr:hypothetical protein [Candidatus Aenigmarchaeota archaeon]